MTGNNNYNKKAADKELEIAANITKDLHNEIVVKKEKKKMPELVFKEFFLPYFNGDQEINDDNPIIAKWVEFAGSIFEPVDLIDNSGNIVNTIPPLYNSSNDDFEESSKIDYSTISSEFNLRSKRSSIAGDAYIEKTLENVSNKINTENDNGIKEWNKVMKELSNTGDNKMVTIEHDEDMSESLDYD